MSAKRRRKEQVSDLVRTVDNDGEEEASDDDGFVLSKEGGLFDDLDSEEEAPDAPVKTWDFEGHHAVADTTHYKVGNLQAKIHQKLQEKGENAPEGPKETPDEAAAAEAHEQAKRAAIAKGTAEHLSTGIHFADLRISRPMLRALTEMTFDSPTPIQRDVIPPAMQGLDILATAETGSGKTAAFLLPMLERLCQSPNVRARKRDVSGRVMQGHIATKALVLLPTRELAVQCFAMLKDLARHTLVTFELVAGGFVQHEQAGALRNQPDIVIATPGRMLDHLLNSQSVHMELLEIVVFDEADRLLELGFKEECMAVLNCCSKGRQTMLFSATLNASVEDLAKLALVKPIRANASPVNHVVDTLEQEFVKVPSEDLREAVLLSLCTRSYTKAVIIFCSTKDAAHRLAIIFGLCGLSFAEIHGNLPQSERVSALTRFQNREADYLLATDLASRGLDLPNVETVINFHLPLDVSRYIHRVGRTARMGRVGRAVTLYCPDDYDKVKKLGKQCCTKVKSKVLKRSVAVDALRQWSGKIADLQGDIDDIREEENMERELRYADSMTDKTANMDKYAANIFNRPPKEWIMTKTEKRQLGEDMLHHAKELEEEGEEVSIGQQRKPKRGVGPRALEDPKERYVRRLKEKAKKAKDDGIKEREKDTKKIREIGKRSKRAIAPKRGKNVQRQEEAFNQKKKRMKQAGKSRKAQSKHQ